MSGALSTIEAAAQKIGTALKYASQINFADAAQAFASADLLGEIETIDDVLKVVGVFVPPVAIAANDLEAAVGGFSLLMQFAALGGGGNAEAAPALQAMLESRFGPGDTFRVSE